MSHCLTNHRRSNLQEICFLKGFHLARAYFLPLSLKIVIADAWAYLNVLALHLSHEGVDIDQHRGLVQVTPHCSWGYSEESMLIKEIMIYHTWIWACFSCAKLAFAALSIVIQSTTKYSKDWVAQQQYCWYYISVFIKRHFMLRLTGDFNSTDILPPGDIPR